MLDKADKIADKVNKSIFSYIINDFEQVQEYLANNSTIPITINKHVAKLFTKLPDKFPLYQHEKNSELRLCIGCQIQQKGNKAEDDYYNFLTILKFINQLLIESSNAKLLEELANKFASVFLFKTVQARLLSSDKTISRTAMQYFVLIIETINSPMLVESVMEFLFASFNYQGNKTCLLSVLFSRFSEDDSFLFLQLLNQLQTFENPKFVEGLLKIYLKRKENAEVKNFIKYIQIDLL